jgi:hypothetical protein
MESQQMIELLLARLDENAKPANKERTEKLIARMDANTKATLVTEVKMNKMKEDMKTMQERAEAERKSDREEMKQEIRAAQEKIQ